MPKPDVSVVLLNYNGREHLAGCLASIEADGWPTADVEVVVADNGSVDGSAELVRGNFPKFRWAAAGSNLGFAAGNRFGVEASAGETLVFLNNDTEVERGWLRGIVDPLVAAPAEVAAVTGRLLSWDGRRIDYHDTLLTFDGHAFQRDFGRTVESIREDPPGAERIAPCGGNMAIRREAFLGAGGFDDDFFAYLEDVDLGLRLRGRGRRILWEPRAVARHRSGATGESLGLYNRGVLIEKNAFAVVWKNWDDEMLRAWLPAVLTTLLHRTERIVREKAVGGERITVDPYREREHRASEDPTRRGAAAGALPVAGIRERIVRKLARILGVPFPAAAGGSPPLAADPHTLSQLRAIHRIVAGLDRLEEKRRQNAAQRRVATREVLRAFPLALVPTYPGDGELFSSAAFRALLPDDPPLVRLRLDEVMAA